MCIDIFIPNLTYICEYGDIFKITNMTVLSNLTILVPIHDTIKRPRNSVNIYNHWGHHYQGYRQVYDESSLDSSYNLPQSCQFVDG